MKAFRKPFVIGRLWISSPPHNHGTIFKDGRAFRNHWLGLVQGTHKRGAISKITGTPIDDLRLLNKSKITA